MNENQRTWHAPGQPGVGSTRPGSYGVPGPGGGAPVPYGTVPPFAPPPSNRGGRRSGRSGGWGKTIVAGIIGALLVLLVLPLAFGVNPYDLVRGKVGRVEKLETTSLSRQVSNVVSATQGSGGVTTIAKKVTPSIVNIDVKIASQGTPFFNTGQQAGTGSGVIYTADGYIITNNHVVADAQDITVTLASGQELKAKQVGADPVNDIAVVKIDKTGLPAIAIGNSDNLEVGQLVVAVGSPLGFEQTVTTGIISALHRNVTAGDQSGQANTLTDLIQTDAPINPGNSGGALCDSSASLIGINAIIASQSGGSEGIGFAIPIDTAKKVADDLIGGRSVSHPYIGVQGQTISADIASQYGLPVTEGAYIADVVAGSPANKAGIKSGDMVVVADGQPVKSMDDLIAAIRKKNIGGKVSVTFYRGSDKKTVDVTVEEEPKNLG
jgi:S1-C subfamily serine protease